MSGYWRNPAATAETMRNGWLQTGDMGSLRRRGYLTLRDRSKDVVISGGSNIYPREVEEALLEHPGVSEAAWSGHRTPSGARSSSPSSSAQPIPLSSMRICCNESPGSNARSGICAVDELPKNSYGKVQQYLLTAFATIAPPRMVRGFLFTAPDLWPSRLQHEKELEQEVLKHLDEQLGAEKHEAIFGVGEVWQTLSGFIGENDIDLLVIGTGGRAGARKLLMGSIAERIFRQATCPVLSIGPNVGSKSRG